MMDATKYAPGYYPVPAGYDSWVKKDHIEKAPAWCSVDLFPMKIFTAPQHTRFILPPFHPTKFFA